MFITVGTFLVGLFGKKVEADTARAVGIGALVTLLIALALIALAIHDHRIIKNHDARQDAEVSNAVIAADRDAGKKKDARDSGFENSQAAVNSAISNAVTADPVKTKQPVGPASQSYYDELRRQKGKH